MITAGDLVMVVSGHPCCGAFTGAEGIPFTVLRVGYVTGRCKRCGAYCEGDGAEGFPGRGPIRLARLIKIDPPAQQVTRETEVNEHA